MWRNNVYNLWCFVAFYNILLPNQFFCNLRCFVAKSVLVQFTHFCVEKNLAKNWARGEGWKVRITTCPEHEASL